MGAETHSPVLLEEVLQGLNIYSDGVYLDCTFGRGGHSAPILKRLNKKGRLLALDKDGDAVNSKIAKKLKCDPRFEIEQWNFSCMTEFVESRGLTGKLSGVLMDLGVSSPQLDDADRGFSFYKDGPLDMRMDKRSKPSAAEWLQTVSENDLTLVLRRFGEERYAKRIAKAIIHERAQNPINRSLQLALLIEQAAPTREQKKHPATRSFQAIRIYINRELDELEKGLQQAVALLMPAGRLVVIAFQSLEDRIVKRFIRNHSRGGDFPSEIPVTVSAYHPVLRRIGKALKPGPEEVARNLRARSAVLRVAEKLP